MHPMLGRVTDRARMAMAHANREALRLRHNAILPEHILLGLIREDGGAAAKALKAFDVDLAQLDKSVVEAAVLAVNRRKVPYVDSRQILLDAQQQADTMKHHAIGTGHMLLAVLNQEERLVSHLGIGLPELRKKIQELLPTDESVH